MLGTSGSATYFHWMFDVLPRIHLLKNCFIKFDDIDLFFVDCSDKDFQKETLYELGIDRSKIWSEFSSFHLESEHLVVPSLPGITGNMPHWACDFLRNQILVNSEESRHRKLYISRSKETHRKLINEREVEDFLEKEGFETIFPQQYTVKEQARLFSSAEFVVAPHGAGLSNLLFCGHGTKVLELFPPGYINVCYWALCNQVSLEYYYAVGRNHDNKDVRSDKNNDFYVDIADLKKGLGMMGL